MSSKQDNGVFSVEKAFLAYNMLTLVMFGLIFAAGYLQYTIAAQQKVVTQTAAAARQQFALTQRMEMAVLAALT